MDYAVKEIKRFDLPYSKIHFSVDTYEIERQILMLFHLESFSATTKMDSDLFYSQD